MAHYLCISHCNGLWCVQLSRPAVLFSRRVLFSVTGLGSSSEFVPVRDSVPSRKPAMIVTIYPI